MGTLSVWGPSLSLVEYLCPRLYKELLEHGYSCSHTPDQETWEGPNCGPEWWFREWEGMVFQVIIENLPGEDPFGRMHVVAPHGHLELGKIDLLSLRKRFAYYEAKLAMMSLVAGGRPTILKGLATARCRANASCIIWCRTMSSSSISAVPGHLPW